MTNPLRVFIAYSHQDEELKQEFEDHLGVLEHQNKIQHWYDNAIEPGTEWNKQILEELDSADIILLLVSPRFIASPFCYGEEVEQAMMRHRSGDAKVIPIILTPTDWKGAPFDRFQVLPKDGKPVTEWPSHDAAFVDVIKGIRRAVDSLLPPNSEENNSWGVIPELDAYITSSDSSNKSASAVRKRLHLFQGLSSLPGPQLEQILFVLNPPIGSIPSASAPLGSRVSALVNWAESPTGPGLDEVDSVFSEIVGYSR